MYYQKCQSDRNEVAYCESKQNARFKESYQALIVQARNDIYPEIIKYTQKHEINADRVSTDTLKIQIVKYKEFRSYLEKFVVSNDIRQYWLTNQKNNTGLDFCIQKNLCTTFHKKQIDFLFFLNLLIIS